MLDDLSKIAKLDKENILSSIEHLPEQISQSWEEIKKVEVPKTCSQVENVIISGMGGSGLGARIVRYLMFDRLNVPIEYVNGYGVPHYTSSKSLVILSSYSGNTEETISSSYDAIKRGAQIFGMTTGGKLEEIFQKEAKPYWKIDPVNNPSNQPRMGLGYSIVGIMGVLAKCNFLSVTDEEVADLVDISESFIRSFGVRVKKENNLAKIMAEKISTKLPILFSSEHLVGVTHAMRNQLDENSKTFSANYKISEANHHLLEGLRYPSRAKDLLHFIFFESDHYYDRIKKRYPITQDVVKQNGYGYDIYKTTSKRKIEEAFEVLIFGSYLSFYLAMLHGIDPAPIPWVDYFKEKMK